MTLSTCPPLSTPMWICPSTFPFLGRWTTWTVDVDSRPNGPPNSPTRKEETVIADLLADLASDIPDLPGAACRGQQHVMDISDGRHRDAIAAAQAICGGCGVLRECEAWLDSLPKTQRPSGVVAGH